MQLINFENMWRSSYLEREIRKYKRWVVMKFVLNEKKIKKQTQALNY